YLPLLNFDVCSHLFFSLEVFQMNTRSNIIMMTIVSALSFCVFIILGSLSPLANLGKNANQFNSVEMWLAIMLVVVIYVISLMLFLIYPKVGKILLAIFCGLGIITFSSSFTMFTLLGITLNILPSLISLLIICAIGVIINIIWYAVAYRGKNNHYRK